MTTVSVVIPYYNRPDWLREALQSVINQTFTDWEAIVVDDGSTEPPGPQALLDPRIRYERQEHSGPSSARNRGLALASGDYIAFLDADDTFLPGKLALQLEALSAHPDAVLSHTSYERIAEDGHPLGEVQSGSFAGRVYPAIVLQCPIATPTVMVRADLLREHGLMFPEAMRFGEDTTLWIQIARFGEIAGIPEAMAKVRLHGRNAFADPQVQFAAGRVILNRAFQKDPSLGFVFRRRAYAASAASAGRMFLGQGANSRAVRCFATALVNWPFDRATLRLFVVLLLPGSVRGFLRRLVGRRGPRRPHS